MALGCKRGAGQSKQVWGCIVLGESRMEGTSRLVLEGGTTVSEADGRQASGRGRKVWVRSRKVWERSKLVVGLHRKVLELHRKVLVPHMMALHFCCFHKQ